MSTSILTRVVRLHRLARDTSSTSERDSAQKEIVRLKNLHQISDAQIDLAVEEADGPYQVDMSTFGPTSGAIAGFLSTIFGDDVIREGGRVFAKANLKQRMNETAARFKALKGQLEACAARRRPDKRHLELYYLVLSLALEDRMKTFHSELPWNLHIRSSMAPPRPAALRRRLIDTRRLLSGRVEGPKIARRPSRGEEPEFISMTESASAPSSELPAHIVEAAYEDAVYVNINHPVFYLKITS